MKVIAFFNNKGGVGKTSLVFHLTWMLSGLGCRTVAADLDPQANLTSMFLDEDRLEELWPDAAAHTDSILGSIDPLKRGIGDIRDPHIEEISDDIGLIAGDLGLSGFEDDLSLDWIRCADGREPSFRTVSAFYRILKSAAEEYEADFVLIDVGPNLGAINRTALIAADHVVVPLAPDLFSLQALRNLGPTLRKWREEWQSRLAKAISFSDLELPEGSMLPLGYVAMQHAVRLDRPVKAYARWMKRIPDEYRQFVLDEAPQPLPSVERDKHCLAQLKHYRSLMPFAMEARKPMFSLKPADGAIGAHQRSVQDCYRDFEALAREIARRANTPLAP